MFFLEIALATMHRRDVILSAFKKIRRGLLWSAFHCEGEGANGCKRRGKGEDWSWKMMFTLFTENYPSYSLKDILWGFFGLC